MPGGAPRIPKHLAELKASEQRLKSATRFALSAIKLRRRLSNRPADEAINYCLRPIPFLKEAVHYFLCPRYSAPVHLPIGTYLQRGEVEP
jgi:hypothetical protein